MITCPLCDADVDVEEDELDEGDSFDCDECGATLRVVGVDPLELDADDEDEDEEDEDEDDDEFADDEDDEDEDEDEENW
jgi:lysine biosynthesis protein LysW